MDTLQSTFPAAESKASAVARTLAIVGISAGAFLVVIAAGVGHYALVRNSDTTLSPMARNPEQLRNNISAVKNPPALTPG